ncbi:hypothetical protein ACIRU8_10255 [Streptomyces sp. NPDC101175]|uniref:hypothetical protein n=1 Tax=Streptomyces sp. NPDC101175 TaxID=3366123 RepID=UPI0038339948
MTDRSLALGTLDEAADDIRDHGFAILQTRIERVPKLVKGQPCYDLGLDGCAKTATLATFAIEQIADKDDAASFFLAKDASGNPHVYVSCDEHRIAASHELFYGLTDQLRPDGIRAFDLPGQYMQWM